MAEITCPGCNKPFSINAWSRHLSQTTRIACRTIYVNQNSYLPGVFLRGNNPPPQPSQQPQSQEPATFAGDFFGDDYQDNDFPWPSDSRSESSDSSESDEEPEDLEDDVRPWEPTPSSNQAAAQPEADAADYMDEEQGRVLTAEERKAAEGKLWATPVVVPFPSLLAGKPIDDEDSEYIRYKKSVGGDGNAYAPFNSKIDWEFARWAKLRGVGSTSATELMGIDGVRFCYCALSSTTFLLTPFIDARYLRPLIQKFQGAK